MRARTWIGWIVTGLMAAFMLLSALPDVLRLPGALLVFHRLGYPPYLLVFLGTAKILGVAAVLVPGLPRIKEWAFAGLTFDVTGALYSHLSIGDPPGAWTPAVIAFALLGGSYVAWRRRVDQATIETHEMVQNVSIRPARPGEQTILESLQRRASLGNPGDRDAITLPIEQITEGCVFVAERDGTVAGFAAVVPRPDGGAELDALFVEPHLWKRGIGRRLVDHIADIARVRAASFLHVIGNPHAEGFYVSTGFRVTGTVETRFGVGLAMRRPL
jgi:GNAT superfamily N-acetyltransferase/uncharacterized membrane protein YphA (DoxX/SURF4 family)